jgi:hypothetical protein
LQLVQENSLAVLKSDAWLVAPEAVVQKVLQLDKLDMSETEVLEALLKWGRAQVDAEGHDPTEDTRLRKKVESSLTCIRFNQFTQRQFAELCGGDLGLVLSGEEKFQIINCIILEQWKKMPAHLKPVTQHGPRTMHNLSFVVTVTPVYKCMRKVTTGADVNSSFTLSVNRRCSFVGLTFIPAEHSAPFKAKMQPDSFKVSEENFPSFHLGRGFTAFTDKDKGLCKLGAECIFEAEVKYIIQFHFLKMNLDTSYKEYRFCDSSNSSANDCKSLRIDNVIVKIFGPLLGVDLHLLMFRKLK